MNGRTIRDARALLLTVVVALASFTLPGHAALGDAPPVLVKTSADTGWTHSAWSIAAAYDRSIAQDATVEVRDVDGFRLEGSVTIDGSNARTVTWTGAPIEDDDRAPLQGEHAPYTVTFSARGILQNSTLYPNPVVTTRSFAVDVDAPVTPQPLTTPQASPSPEGVVVIQQGDSLEITGMASDVDATSASAMSGIAKVELHFYNAALTARPTDPTHAGGEVMSLRRTIAASACGATCEQTLEYTWAVDSLPQGYWNVKVSAIDLAGWRSQESAPVKVLSL